MAVTLYSVELLAYSLGTFQLRVKCLLNQEKAKNCDKNEKNKILRYVMLTTNHREYKILFCLIYSFT